MDNTNVSTYRPYVEEGLGRKVGGGLRWRGSNRGSTGGSREAIWQFRSNCKTKNAYTKIADRLTTHSRVDDYMTNE
jgi:hypothetical protein